MELLKPELDVALVASNPDVSCAFYRDVIGLTPEPSVRFGNGVQQDRFSLGNHRIKLNRLPQPPARESGGVDAAVGIRLLALILEQAHFEAILARLDAAGRRHAPYPLPADAPYRVNMVKDPDGNLIELVGLKAAPGSGQANRIQIGLTVSDVARSREFYGKVLGLHDDAPTQNGEGSGRNLFVWGKTTIKFWGGARELPVRTGAPNSRAGLRTFTGVVKDIDAAHAQLLEKGVPITLAPLELPGIARILFFADPDGNWIELSQRF